MGKEFREWPEYDDAGDSSPDAVGERPGSALSDLMAANARYLPEDPNNPETDVPAEDEPAEHGDQPGEDASAAALRESVAAVNVSGSRGSQIGDGNLQINIISVEALDRLERNAPPAAALASLLASLAHGLVPANLLLATGNAAWPQGSEAARVLGRLPRGQTAIKDAMAELRQYELAAQVGNGLVQMSGPARNLTRTRLTSRAQAALWRQVAAGLVAAAIAAVGQLPDARPDWAALLPHARAVLDLTSDGIWQLALSLARSGRYAKARDLCALIIDAYRDSGDDGPRYQAASRKLIEWTRLAANEH